MVRPSEEHGLVAATVQLSSLDQGVPPCAISSLLMFDQPIDKPIETIKQALSQALVHYRPVSGRLAGDRIACTTDEWGVPFVGASATCALDEVTVALLPDLAVAYAGSLCGDHEPLLQMQVTEFSCGGFVVAVTWNHILADGAGMGQFLQAVGELARGLPRPSVVPVRSATALGARGLPPSTVGAERSAMGFRPSKGEGAFLDITVPWSLIGRVRAQCARCTVFEAVAAVLWRCRTRAAIPDTAEQDQMAPLVFACNVRKLFGLGADDGYYGNCFVLQWVPATRAQVADGDIRDVVGLIRRAKEKIPELLEGGAAEREQTPLYNILGVSSWRGVGLDEADFGGGRPARVMWHEELMVVPACAVLPPPCKGKDDDDGVNVASLCVKPEHADAFLAELAAM